MIPAPMSQEMVRRCNLALWTHHDHMDQAEALTFELGNLMRAYGISRMRKLCNIDPCRMTRPRITTKRICPTMTTILKVCRYLGLRVRIEIDPDPRHMQRPPTSLEHWQQRLDNFYKKDPSGRLAQQAIARRERAAAKKREYDLHFQRARRERMRQ